MLKENYNNNFFDNGIDTIFNSLNIEETTPEEFNLKASILEEIEKQIDNPRFQENGDIIFVSEKLEYNKWTRTQEIMTTLGQMAAIIMVIQNAIGN